MKPSEKFNFEKILQNKDQTLATFLQWKDSPKKFYLCGRLQNAPTQNILKPIDYQINKI